MVSPSVVKSNLESLTPYGVLLSRALLLKMDCGLSEREKLDKAEVLCRALEGELGVRGIDECERPDAGDAKGLVVDAVGSIFAGLRFFIASPSTRPPAGVCCLRDLTSNVPVP